MSEQARASLANAHCTTSSGPEQRLSDARISALLALLDGWTLDDGGQALQRSFHFSDYYQTMAFVNALAFIAHRENHHPDLGVYYDRVKVRLSTHDAGGLTRNDFICAARIDRLLA